MSRLRGRWQPESMKCFSFSAFLFCFVWCYCVLFCFILCYFVLFCFLQILARSELKLEITSDVQTSQERGERADRGGKMFSSLFSCMKNLTQLKKHSIS